MKMHTVSIQSNAIKLFIFMQCTIMAKTWHSSIIIHRLVSYLHHLTYNQKLKSRVNND